MRLARSSRAARAPLSWTDVTDPSNADTTAGFHYSYRVHGEPVDQRPRRATTHDALVDQRRSTARTTTTAQSPIASSVIDKDNASQTTGAARDGSQRRPDTLERRDHERDPRERHGHSDRDDLRPGHARQLHAGRESGAMASSNTYRYAAGVTSLQRDPQVPRRQPDRHDVGYILGRPDAYRR